MRKIFSEKDDSIKSQQGLKRVFDKPGLYFINITHFLGFKLLVAQRHSLSLLVACLFHEFLGEWVDAFALISGDLLLVLSTNLLYLGLDLFFKLDEVLLHLLIAVCRCAII